MWDSILALIIVSKGIGLNFMSSRPYFFHEAYVLNH